MPAYRHLHNPRSENNTVRSARHHGGPGRRSAAAPRREETAATLCPNAPRGTRPAAALRRSGPHTSRPIPAGGGGGSSYPIPSSDQPGHSASPPVSGDARSRLLSRPLPAETPAAVPPSRQLLLPPRCSRLLRLPASRLLWRRVRVRPPRLGSRLRPARQRARVAERRRGRGGRDLAARARRQEEGGGRRGAAPGDDRKKGRVVTGPGATPQLACRAQGACAVGAVLPAPFASAASSWGRATSLALPASRPLARGGRAAGPERYRGLRWG